MDACEHQLPPIVSAHATPAIDVGRSSSVEFEYSAALSAAQKNPRRRAVRQGLDEAVAGRYTVNTWARPQLCLRHKCSGHFSLTQNSPWVIAKYVCCARCDVNDVMSRCLAGPVPKAVDCSAEVDVQCKDCLEKNLKSWCWVDNACHTLGSAYNPCAFYECASASVSSNCQCSACGQTSCRKERSNIDQCNECLSASLKNWCWQDLQCHAVGSVTNPCTSAQCTSGSFSSACQCSDCDDIVCKGV